MFECLRKSLLMNPIIVKRKGIACFFTIAIFLNGSLQCINPGKRHWIDLTIEPIGTIKSGDTCSVMGFLEATDPIDSLSFSVNDSFGNPTPSSFFEILYSPSKGKNRIDLQKDASLTIVSKVAAYPGDYWLVIEAIIENHKFLWMKQFSIGQN